MAVPNRITLYVLNDQYIELNGVADGISGTLNTTAVITGTVYDPSGAAVATATNISFAAVGGSPGVFRGLVPNTFNPTTLGGGYLLKIDSNDSGVKEHLEIAVVVAVRKT